MGLDDFSSSSSTDKEKSKTSSESETSNGTSQTTITDPADESEMNFYGTGEGEPGTTPMERKGAMSNHSMAELAQTADGEINVADDRVKYYLPYFTMMTREQQYYDGNRYQLKCTKDEPKPSWHGKVVACVAASETRLGSMNKELTMLETGSTSKKRVMEGLKNRLGEDIDADTNIYIQFFADIFFIRDLAQANEEFRVGDLLNREKITNKVANPKQLRVHMGKQED